MKIERVIEQIETFTKWNRYACFLISEEAYKQLPKDKFKSGNGDMKNKYGFLYSTYENIPVLYNTDVVEDNVVCIEKDLVKSLM